MAEYPIYLQEPLRKIGDYADSVNSGGTVTRCVKKLVLTGSEENWVKASETYPGVFYISNALNTKVRNGICSHLPFETNIVRGSFTVSQTYRLNLWFPWFNNETELTDFKTYLAAQYAAGTPVTVWYVLAEPIIETITPTIITATEGSNTLTVDTTLPPSNITITTDSNACPANPIIPEECGDLITSGEYEGKYEIPLTCNNLTNNIIINEPIRKIGDYSDSIDYNGVVTRNIKKLVLTGEENWRSTSGRMYLDTLSDDYMRASGVVTCICTHYSAQEQIDSASGLTKGCVSLGSNPDNQRLYIYDFDISTANDFKTYLASQYAARTPVCVWYVLATPIEESITVPQITTAIGYNTLDSLTTLQPSSITIDTSSSVYPKNPIYPEGVGDKTVNMFDVSTIEKGRIDNGVVGYAVNTTSLTIDGGTVAFTTNANYRGVCTGFFEIPSTGTVSFNFTPNKTLGVKFVFYDSSKSWLGADYIHNIADPFPAIATIPNGAKYVRMSFTGQITGGSDYTMSNIMLNSGSTSLPYEQYGYKIPISLNNQTYNLYTNDFLSKIGNYSDISSYSTSGIINRIKKVVFDGTEDILRPTAHVFRLPVPNAAKISGTTVVCTHFLGVDNTDSPSTNLGDNEICVSLSASVFIALIYVKSGTISALDDFKTYLQQQYAAGTPVTVWYVLSEEESEQATIPQLTLLTDNTNTLTVNTELTPPEVDVNYYVKGYTQVTSIPIQNGTKEVKDVLDANGLYVYKSSRYYNWNNIRDIVRAGKAPNYYPLGSIIYDNFNSQTGTAFQVIAYDKHFDPNLTAQGYTHSITLCELLLTDVYVFDNIEAFLFTETSIPAGTYKFTIPNYDATYGGNKTYYFTSTANIPEKTQIVMNWPYNQTPKTVSAYASNIDTTKIPDTTAITGFDALTLYEYIDGESPEAVDLGTIAGPSTQLGTSNYGQMNHIHRARYGSNNYLQSGLRLYLNSTSAANTWWEMQTIFDRPYSQRTQNGKLTKLNQNLVNILATPTIQSRTNSYFEIPSLDGTTFTLSTNYNITTDKMFLLSPYEVNLNADTTVGTILDYYTNADNNKRIKLRKSNNTAYYWWLRTPNPSNAHYVRFVYTSGALNSYLASNSYGAAPACTIQ